MKLQIIALREPSNRLRKHTERPEVEKMNTIESRAMTTFNPEITSLADSLASDIARSLHEGWTLKQRASLKLQRPGELLHQFFDYVHDQWPHDMVLSIEGVNLKYSELDLHSNHLTRTLRKHGVTTESSVGICLPRSIDAYVALLAVLKLGGDYVQLDPQTSCEQIRYMGHDAKLTAIITDAEPVLREDEGDAPLLNLGYVHNVDAEPLKDKVDYGLPGMRGDLCYIIYTTSERERPKGVAVELCRKLQKLRSLVYQYSKFGFLGADSLWLSNREFSWSGVKKNVSSA